MEASPSASFEDVEMRRDKTVNVSPAELRAALAADVGERRGRLGSDGGHFVSCFFFIQLWIP